MKFMVFNEMPVGTIFEASGLKYRKTERALRPDNKGYFNALQVGIEEGYALIKEDNLYLIPTKNEEISSQRRRRSRRSGKKPNNPRKPE